MIKLLTLAFGMALIASTAHADTICHYRERASSLHGPIEDCRATCFGTNEIYNTAMKAGDQCPCCTGLAPDEGSCAPEQGRIRTSGGGPQLNCAQSCAWGGKVPSAQSSSDQSNCICCQPIYTAQPELTPEVLATMPKVTIQGKASFASDCSVQACYQTKISSLGMLIRGEGKSIGFKFNEDGTYAVSLTPGEYFIYEDDSWKNTSLTAEYPGIRVDIAPGKTTRLDIKVDNVKAHLQM